MLIFDHRLLDNLCLESNRSSRRRQHLNMHRSFDERCRRLFNATQPDSYIPPHRHALSNMHEFLIAVKGRFALVTSDDEGA